MINEKTAASLDQTDDRTAYALGDSRASQRGPEGTKVLHIPVAHIRGPMQYDLPLQRHIVIAGIHSLQLQGKTIVAYIGALGHIESEAALIRIRFVGKSGRIFIAGILTVSDISAIQQPFVLHVDHIHSLLPGGLTKIADR